MTNAPLGAIKSARGASARSCARRAALDVGPHARRVERLEVASPATGSLTVSVSVAEVDPSRDKAPADWIACADAALYRAKSQGRNQVVATPSVSAADA